MLCDNASKEPDKVNKKEVFNRNFGEMCTFGNEMTDAVFYFICMVIHRGPALLTYGRQNKLGRFQRVRASRTSDV